MAIPADILRVERPKNTFVVSYGSKDCPKYAVRKRLGCKYDKGRRLPINGPTIGHIINFKYIPIEVEYIENLSTVIYKLSHTFF